MSSRDELDFDKYLESDIVEVRVDDNFTDEPTAFRLHESLLRAKTSIFEKLTPTKLHPQLQYCIGSCPILSFREYVRWLYHGDRGNIVWDYGLWRIAHDLGSADLQNYLLDDCQTRPFDHVFVGILYSLTARGWAGTLNSKYMKEKAAYEILHRGMNTVLDIAGGKNQVIQLRELCLDEVGKITLLMGVKTELEDMTRLQQLKEGDLEDPAEHKGCKWHLHLTEESKKKCPRYRPEE